MHRNADVEEQIGHLRAQLLRSEQDNELMRIKLEQETAEREKAQKQVGEVLSIRQQSNVVYRPWSMLFLIGLFTYTCLLAVKVIRSSSGVLWQFTC